MRLKAILAKDPAQNPVITRQYTYSPIGNITAKQTEHGNYTYQYDTLYRLTNAVNPTNGTNGTNETYTYDPVGNRLTSASTTAPWQYNANNELQNFNGTSYQYDANGNIISKTDQAGTTTYTYDVDNRLIKVRNPQSEIYNYYYDPFGRRLWKEVGGMKTYFFYSDEGLIGEYDGSGIQTKAYGYVPDSTWTTDPLFIKEGGNYYFYHNDHLGTPQQLTSISGAVVWTAQYNAYGEAQVDAGSSVTNNLRFPGQYFDDETGLHYNLHRYYDPETGRYLSTDPIGFEGGINLFAYVKNNPIKNIDPNALLSKCENVALNTFLVCAGGLSFAISFGMDMALIGCLLTGPDWPICAAAVLAIAAGPELAALYGCVFIVARDAYDDCIKKEKDCNSKENNLSGGTKDGKKN